MILINSIIALAIFKSSPSAPLQTYLVSESSTSSVSSIPSAFVSSPTSIFTPPLAQLSPAASSLVLISVFKATSPSSPAGP